LDRPVSRFREIAASSIKVGAATVAALLGWIVGGKILAVELGAAGVGVFGLLRQLLQNLTLISTFNGSTALVQGVSSRPPHEVRRYVTSVGGLFAVGAGVVALGLLIGAPWLGPLLIPHPQSPALLRWLALAVVATTAQSFFTGLLNGHRAVNALVRSQLLAPLAVLAMAAPVALFVRKGNPAGFVLMLAVPGAIVALAAMRHARRNGWLGGRDGGWISRRDATSFFGTSSVLVASGLLSTGTQYFQSRFVAARLGLEQAGLYWVAWTLSMSYVTILLGSYGAYYMPSLSALKDQGARQALIRDYLRLALSVMPVVVAAVILAKPVIVGVMFSPALFPALTVMRWMLIGDFFKGIAWVLSFPMLAFNEMRWFFWTEAAFNLLLAGASAAWLMAGGSIEGLGIVFVVLYAAYLLAMSWYIRWVHHLQVRRAELLAFLAGLSLVLVASVMTWRDVELRASPLVVVTACCAVFLYGMRRCFVASGAPAPRDAAVIGDRDAIG
jgi:O-antigen/teichoic acid export membrane protein